MPGRLITDTTFRRQHLGPATFSDVRLERCIFENCYLRGGRLARLQLIECRTWSCSLADLMIEDTLIDGLATTTAGGGGKRSPLFLWGVRSDRMTLRGRVGSVIWNGPRHWAGSSHHDEIDLYRRHYESVEWALDVTEAEFTSVPTFRFGPPAHLVRRDPMTQPIVTRERVQSADWGTLKRSVGVWEVVINRLLDQPWPDDAVLLPAKAGKHYKAELAGIALLRAAGIAI